jgi:hypothetical protein
VKTVVELEGVNGEWFTIAGDDAGDRGVYLATGVTGLFDPPVKASYEEPGNYPGARYLSHRILRRDLVFAVHILEDGESWLSRDSEWRKAWAFDRDCKLYVTTEASGTRYLKVRLFESPDVDTETDPNGRTLTTVKMITVAGDPFWYQDDVVYTAVTKTDTSFDPNQLPWPWPQNIPSETLTITVDPDDGRGGLNPTDQYIFPKWTVPGSTYAPAEPYIPGVPWLGAPRSRGTVWTLPDYSFEDPEKADRRVKLPPLIGGLRVDEIQSFNLDGIVESGTFDLKLGSETATNIPWNVSTDALKQKLESLASIGYDDVEVGRGKVTNEVQVVNIEGATGGTFTLSFAGQTTQPIPFNADDTTLWNALHGLNNINLFDVKITSKVTNEVQVIKLVGEPTGGTFTLTFDGQTTDPIPWNANSIRVFSALNALPNLDTFDFTVNQEWWKPYAPWTIGFNGIGTKFRGVNVPTITADPDGLEGGAGMDVVVSTETQGSRPYVITFRGARAGQNVPQLIGNTGGLTGPNPTIRVYTDNPGSYPYVIRFRNALSGQTFPLIEIDTTKLAGPDKIEARVWRLTEGVTHPAENCVIDTDPRVEQVVSESGSPIWSRMNGVRFRHPIPPWTRDKTFEITVSGTVPGQMVSLRLPRPWSRPWGLE